MDSWKSIKRRKRKKEQEEKIYFFSFLSPISHKNDILTTLEEIQKNRPDNKTICEKIQKKYPEAISDALTRAVIATLALEKLQEKKFIETGGKILTNGVSEQWATEAWSKNNHCDKQIQKLKGQAAQEAEEALREFKVPKNPSLQEFANSLAPEQPSALALFFSSIKNIPKKPSLQPHRYFYEQLLDMVKSLGDRLSQLFTLLKHYMTGKPLLVPSTPPQNTLPCNEYEYCKKKVVTYLTHSYPTHTHPIESDNSQEQSQDTSDDNSDDNAHYPHIPPNGLGPK